MTTPTRRTRLAEGRPPFGLRELVFCFGFIIITICGAGLTFKELAQAASGHPGTAVLIGAATIPAAAAVIVGRKRAHSARNTTRDRLARELAERALVIERYQAMEPDAFEHEVAQLCERDGCLDVQVVGGANDLGADVVATAPDGRRVVIQCKRYGADNKVGSQDVQRFGGTCYAVHDAHVAAVVTTSEFTGPAADYADQCGILCFDQDALAAWATGTGTAPWA